MLSRAMMIFFKASLLCFMVINPFSVTSSVKCDVNLGNLNEISWPQERLFPKFPSPDHLYVVDLRTVSHTRALTLLSLQGLDGHSRLYYHAVRSANATAGRRLGF